MTVDTEIKMRGLDALTNSLGLVDAERFVLLSIHFLFFAASLPSQ
jgi:hypothetical protein